MSPGIKIRTIMRLKTTVEKIKAPDKTAMRIAKERQDRLTKPTGSLGTLEELSIRIAGITGDTAPKLKNKVIIIMAGDHGVTDAGVSAYPKEITAQMIYNFVRGGAAINVLARHVGARVVVVDMGVAADIEHEQVIDKKIAYGTSDMTKGAAMTYDDAMRSIEAGIDVFEHEAAYKGVDIVCVGDMGIGNTTPSSAITAVITGAPVSVVTGRGAGIDDAALEKKIAALQEKLAAPDLYQRDRKAFEATTADLGKAQAELAEAEERWLELEMLRESLS